MEGLSELTTWVWLHRPRVLSSVLLVGFSGNLTVPALRQAQGNELDL